MVRFWDDLAAGTGCCTIFSTDPVESNTKGYLRRLLVSSSNILDDFTLNEIFRVTLEAKHCHD
jgi:hypothetical protein